MEAQEGHGEGTEVGQPRLAPGAGGMGMKGQIPVEGSGSEVKLGTR